MGSQAAICGGVVFTKVNDSKYRDGRQGSSESLNDENYRDRDQRATSLDGSKLRVSLDTSDAGFHNTGTVTYLSRGGFAAGFLLKWPFASQGLDAKHDVISRLKIIYLLSQARAAQSL